MDRIVGTLMPRPYGQTIPTGLPILDHHQLSTGVDPQTINAVLAAHAGFLLGTGLEPALDGLRPITDAKIRLGRGSLKWLQRRLRAALARMSGRMAAWLHMLRCFAE